MDANLKETARLLAIRVETCLKAEFGNQVRVGGGSYDSLNLNLKVTMPIVQGKARSNALRQQFEKLAPIVGLRPEDFDLPIKARGKPAKLVSIEPGRPKFPFVVEADGKRIKVTTACFLVARQNGG
jgi:hypothetical protein